MEKIALVTGSTSNIGRAIAETLSRDGYRVIITSRSEQGCREVAGKLAQEGFYFHLDFSRTEDIKALFGFIKDKFGRLDVLVNNMAYTKNESTLDCNLDTWQRTIDTNLRSYYLCSRYAALLMKDNGGSIVNITIASTRGHKKQVFLCRKQRRDKLSNPRRRRGPGALQYPSQCRRRHQTGTPVGSRTFDGRVYENKKIPVGHIGDPQDVANMVAFLVSDKAGFILGAIIPVDGGSNIAG